jgi:hypothetical protein
MNIEIKHVITLAPEVLTLLQAFLGKGKEATPAPALAASSSPKAEAKAVAKVETPAPAKEVAAPQTANDAATTTYTVEQVREIAQKKILANKMPQVKELLTSFAAKSISALDEKHYTEFVEKVNAL